MFSGKVLVSEKHEGSHHGRTVTVLRHCRLYYKSVLDDQHHDLPLYVSTISLSSSLQLTSSSPYPSDIIKHSSSPTSRSSHSRLAKLNVFPDGYQLASGFSGVLALDLSDCGLGVQAATPLADFLKSTLTLRVFGLSFNELGGSGMRKILAAVLSQLSGLVPADVLKVGG